MRSRDIFYVSYKVNSKNLRIRKGWNKQDCFFWAKSLHNRILSKKCHLEQDYAQISKIFGYFWRTRRIFFAYFHPFFVDYSIFHPFTMPNRPLPRFSQRKNWKYTYLSNFWLLTPHSRALDKIFIWNDNNIIFLEFYRFQSALKILIQNIFHSKISWFSGSNKFEMMVTDFQHYRFAPNPQNISI